MFRKVILVIFTMAFFIVPASAQQVFELELREGGNYYFGEGFVNGQILSAFGKTQFRVVPSFNGYGNNQNPNKIRVFVSCNNQTASTSTSSNFRYSSSYSRNTKLYGDLTITATIITPTWADSRTVSVSGGTSFVENSDLSIHTGSYSFNIPSSTSREQKQIEMNKALLAKALSQLVGDIASMTSPAPALTSSASSMYNKYIQTKKRARVTLDADSAQVYSQRGYISVLRNGELVRYDIVKTEGRVLTIEYIDDPPRKGEKLY